MESQWSSLNKQIIFIILLLALPSSALVSNEAKESAPLVFSKTKVRIGKKELSVEVADHPAAHGQGLMHRKSLPENSGMLFVFSEERTLSFWMKNTLIPLSIAFINAQKKIVDIQDMNPLPAGSVKDLPVYPSAKPARYALEVNQGWFVKNKIKVGDSVQFKVAK
jgi:uncharacterized membrane protein (UPF0127 family)